MSLIPQIGMFELLLLGAIALMIVGPKDLPRLMHGFGKIVGQMKSMANEFRAGFDQMAREVEMEEMRAEIEALKKANPINEVKRAAEEAAEPLKAEGEKLTEATRAND